MKPMLIDYQTGDTYPEAAAGNDWLETIWVDEAWQPDFSKIEDGFECLAFHRGRWRHVKWIADQNAFSLGYGRAFIVHTIGERVWCPLPPKPTEADGFFDWKD